MSVTYEFKVRWGDTDAAGIVFYPNFFKWMDEATHEFMLHLGKKSSEWITQENITIPLLETTCEFKTPLYFEDEVIVTSSVTNVGNKVFTMEHLFTRNGERIASGKETRAWTSCAGKLKATPLPEHIKEIMYSL